MLKVLKSDTSVAKLSVTWKLPNQRRKYPTSIDTPGSTSCCTDVENSQLKKRLPHPRNRSSSNCSIGTVPPKVWFAKGPHSPLAPGAVRLQSGTKSRSVSVHARVVLSTSLRKGLGVPARL